MDFKESPFLVALGAFVVFDMIRTFYGHFALIQHYSAIILSLFKNSLFLVINRKESAKTKILQI
tara:strand:- start:315 stop:506 length:192 start_codon:yes stop_codon:yes gene_type:complete